MSTHEDISGTIDHLFRKESGKMVSVLTNIFGSSNLQTAEDVVQITLEKALHTWKIKGIPDNPNAWLYRVAKNTAIDILRKNKYSNSFDFTNHGNIILKSEYTISQAIESKWNKEEIEDDMLRMMFACCHPDLSVENQLCLLLKTLGGLSTSEISKALLIGEDTVSKRIYRSKEFFRKNKIQLFIPKGEKLTNHIGSVLKALYLIFNEGYNSTQDVNVIRVDLVQDAMSLCKMLCENKFTNLPESNALMSLMCLHAARFESRMSENGDIILLEDQDRNLWDSLIIEKGREYLTNASYGNQVSTYHVEAAIAYEHCKASDFEETDWLTILQCYDWLNAKTKSPIVALNRAIVYTKVNGAKKGLNILKTLEEDKILNKYYLYYSFLGDIYAELGNTQGANSAFHRAIELTKSEKEKKLILGKISNLEFYK